MSAPFAPATLAASSAWGARDITPWVPQELPAELPAQIGSDFPLEGAREAAALAPGARWPDIAIPGGA